MLNSLRRLWHGVFVIACAMQANAGLLDDARELHGRGELEQALRAYDAVVTQSPAGGEGAVARNNACVILTGMGRLDDALTYCQQALRWRRSSGDLRATARTLNNLARVHEAQGRFDVARLEHNEALALNTERDDLNGQVISRLNLGVLETNVGQYALALSHYAAADVILANVEQAPWRARQQVLLALNRGVVLEQIGAYQEALGELDSALNQATLAAPERIADAQLNRGVILRNLGDPAAALAAYDQALAVFELRGDAVAIANVALNKAIVQWQDRGDIDAARVAAEQARLLSRDSSDALIWRDALYVQGRILLDAGRIDDAADARAQMIDDAVSSRLTLDLDARLARANGRLERARRFAIDALTQIESRRAQLGATTMRQRLLSDRRAAYTLAVEILFAQYQREASDEAAEQALSVVARAKALARLETPSPRVAEESGRGDTSYLELFVTAGHVYVWTRTASMLVWQRHEAEALNDAAGRLFDAVRTQQPPAAKTLQTLDVLLGALPLEGEQLVVAPDGIFGAVPFELLLADRAQKPLATTVVRYVATTRLGLRAREATSTGRKPRLLALARPNVSAKTPPHPALRALPELAGVVDEVTRISRVFDQHAVVLDNEAATEAVLRERTDFDVLHIASHAVLDRRLDDGAVLILGASESDDGLLFPRDVAQLSMSNALTVLSGCSTAGGDASTGAPVSNLAGAFLAAGSSAVLATLWDVADSDSVLVMEEFYAQLARGLPPHRALHESKRRLIKSHGAPTSARWAAWVVYGASDAAVFDAQNGPLSWWVWSLIFPGLVGGLFFLARRRHQAVG